MSSFVGHGLVAAAIGVARRGSVPERRPHIALGAWLIGVAWSPDIDDAVPDLRPGAHGGTRVVARPNRALTAACCSAP